MPARGCVFEASEGHLVDAEPRAARFHEGDGVPSGREPWVAAALSKVAVTSTGPVSEDPVAVGARPYRAHLVPVDVSDA